ncbi:regulatory protein, tetR family [Parafrankia irregularis]|uniref:Regulatory protein, tetR family n=1 Tax=Parafrankia irregularis TaxID=795642 RepID=A0A0S4QSC8_9ACTN|nr:MULTISPECIES: TetR/AcrR family transcriptional regulator [Parafrankia]MBE3204642.1 TetR/AcrR family transcriptional regulator [Parafrankia sp. CH37]CUU58497.1 regulatory protein, tetR family [Parafrankia irregularis]
MSDPDSGESGTAEEMDALPPKRRPYESPTRRQQAAQTRDRIVAAGAEMVHGFASWDWRDLTVRAVARRAGVSETTVYRHFATDRRLHEAVMRRLEEEADIELEDLQLDTFDDLIRRMFTYLASFPISPPTQDDPTFAAADERRRAALIAAVTESADGWSDEDRETAAAMLDVLWSVPSFERLTTVWHFDADRATNAATWLVRLVRAAVREGLGPSR